jgi:NAD(P)-dependent dehydrogenase (short-subunit alcohol dehydrogenase family)
MTAVTVVTGAAGALGAEIVRALVSEDHRVALVDRPEASERLAKQAQSFAAGSCLALPLDVTNASTWAEAVQRIEQELGPVTGGVLTAGGWQGGKAFDTPEADEVYASMLHMNLETARCSLRALLPGLVARKHGSLVVTGSRAVERPWESANAAAYAASKAAVVALAQAIAAEVLLQSVRVNAVLPSTLDTEANRRAMPKADFSRWVSLSSLAAVIRFLLSDSARDISGAALPVYGRV